ncbi:sensor histidine kinase [Amycolatopsis sp. 195334CR]|uniref:sensor histidine kinase n=1 Tax=Amycolatopsis sp. 195334CR TaxID=2814588 RepID=UPI001F5C9B14|nr:sensor histidine kinase [Amycolatopsis sp. 195334CR]
MLVGVLPRTLSRRDERRAGCVFAAVGLAGLAISAVWHVLTAPDATTATSTLVLIGAATLWMPLVIWVFPRRTSTPGLVVLYYLGFLALATALSPRGDGFAVFASVGYPLAFGLLTPRMSFFGVAATAILPMVARGGTDGPTWVTLVSVAAPLLYAGWVVGSESEKRRKSNAQLEEANAKLETALEENAGLHAQLLSQARETGVLDERQRMAGEIHDTIAQGLAGIITQLQAAERSGADAERRQRHLDNVHALARENLTEARRSVRALRPERLADSRLPDAMAELGRTWTDTSGVPVKVEVTGDPRPLLPDLEVTLYRVAQEALTNTGKHAKASRVALTLSYVDDVVMLDVRDDGVGFTPGAPSDSGGFGLSGMRQRVQRVAGTLAVESTPGEGTTINAQLPAIVTANGEPT